MVLLLMFYPAHFKPKVSHPNSVIQGWMILRERGSLLSVIHEPPRQRSPVMTGTAALKGPGDSLDNYLIGDSLNAL